MNVPEKRHEPAPAAGHAQEDGMIQELEFLCADSSDLGVQQAPLPMSHSGSDSVGLSQTLPKLPAGVGIMVFSAACKLLYANQMASEFLKMLNLHENGHGTDGALPASIAGLFDRMQLSLGGLIVSREGEPFEAKRLVMWQDQTVLLQAFGLVDRLGMRGSRVIMMMRGVIHPCDDEPTDGIPLST